MKLLYVKWIDASGPAQGGWLDSSELEEHLEREMLIEDVGWVVKEDKDYLCLVSGCSIEPEDSEWCSIFHHLIKIPRPCIRRKVDLTKHLKKAIK